MLEINYSNLLVIINKAKNILLFELLHTHFFNMHIGLWSYIRTQLCNIIVFIDILCTNGLRLLENFYILIFQK